MKHDKQPSAQSERSRSIWLFCLLVLTLSLMLGAMVFNMSKTYKNARNDVIELSKSSALINAGTVDIFLTRHMDMLVSAGRMLELQLAEGNNDPAEVETLLKYMSTSYNDMAYRPVTQQEFTGIYAAVDGRMIHGFRGQGGLPAGYDPTKRPWYQQGYAGGGEVVFGDPYIDIYEPHDCVMSETKLLSDGETVIGMDITLRDLQSILSKMELTVAINGKHYTFGHGLVLSETGYVMGHWLPEEQGKCYSDPNNRYYEVYQSMMDCLISEEDYFESKLGGITYGIFPHQLSNGWIVVTLTDLDEVRTSISDFSSVLLLGTIIVIVLVLLYAFLISRAYVRADTLTKDLKSALSLATTDNLTGYRNRTAYDMRITELRKRMGTAEDTGFVYMMVDLNDLKYVNDRFGHVAGDQYIVNCCALIHSIVSADIYRIGGDEFVVILTDDEFIYWESCFDQLKKAVAAANIALTPNVDTPSLAIGVALHEPGQPDDIDDLIRKADAEMYTNKAAIKLARLEHSDSGYTPDLKLKVLDKQILASELKRGLDEEQFEVWFQPQVNHADHGAIIGCEALVRWPHPERGFLSPMVFIPLFEYNGMIYELDKYVWRHTCKLMREWIATGLNPIPVSVNMSRLDLLQPDFLETVKAITEEYNIPHEYLHLEVTESAFSDNTGRIVEIVNVLIDMGFTVAIDDFGTGYSSLSLLRNVPAHMIKLDMRFFDDGKNKSRNECIIESIIRMVKMLGMAIIAEGVETAEQADLLRAFGCVYIQGYLYSKPLPFSDFWEYVHSNESERINSLGKERMPKPYRTTKREKELFLNIVTGTAEPVIVVEAATKKLLYANRAAEQYYQKHFDPLHPMTCIDYCNRKELCVDCPANDLAPNEKREHVTEENGRFIKTVYTPIEWNGVEAFVSYQTDVTGDMREIEYADNLMNDLGVGILIFKGSSPQELKPVFCNHEFTRMSGLTREEFERFVTKPNAYGVIPEDIGQAREKFAEAYERHIPMRHYLRVRRGDGDTRWISLYINIKHHESGSFTAYFVISDADEEMRKRAIDVTRYETHIESAYLNTSHALYVTHLNLDRGTCESIQAVTPLKQDVEFHGKIEDFLHSAMQNIASETYREEFEKKFSVRTLRSDFRHGVFTDEMRLPLSVKDRHILWCHHLVSLSKNPNTGDLEAVFTLIEADKEIRKAQYYHCLVAEDYELVGSINVETEFLTIIEETNPRGLPNIDSSVMSYMSNLTIRMSLLVSSEAVDASVRAMTLQTIQNALEKTAIYVTTFPAKRGFTVEERLFQWTFRYVDETHTDILFTRRMMLKQLLEPNE